jgi:ATP-dependent Lon protease
MREVVEIPERLAILPFTNRVLLPGAIVQIRCTSPARFVFLNQYDLVITANIMKIEPGVEK